VTLFLSILLAISQPDRIWLDEILPVEQSPIGPMILIDGLEDRQRWEV